MKSAAITLLVALAPSFGSVADAAALAALKVRLEPRFGNAPLTCDTEEYTAGTGQTITLSRLDLLASMFALRQAGGGWVGPAGWSAYVSAGSGRISFEVPGIPQGRYTHLAFCVGLPPKLNRADPSVYPADHPLNPQVNGLHWSWQAGYVFMALEGGWFQPDGERSGFSWHLATDRQLMRVEVPAALTVTGDLEVVLALDVRHLFDGTHRIKLDQSTVATHSREGDELADKLRENAEGAIRLVSSRPLETLGGLPRPPKVVLKAPDAKPLRLRIPPGFPQPELPEDNPLTEEGVALGRVLFAEQRLSVNRTQSCASCHQESAAFSDAGQAFSKGAEGQLGTRNSMPLFNLAWRRSFFWDGRTATLREQVLQPIQNPVEMHETLKHAVAKLHTAPGEGGPDYPKLFARAFGTPEINPDRMARALEQFLLTLLSHDAKFDRVMARRETFSPEEQRGFELFHTEYDPGRGQRGADCFHCHGGPLFQSTAFANNGLDSGPRDAGRFLATGRAGDQGKFAVPSLRDISRTAPYMHDGRFATLEEVVEHYSTGVKRSPTLDPNLAKHPAGGVPLSSEDQRALVAFLMTLTHERQHAEPSGAD